MPERTCPFCGAELKAEILSGLCPKCVVKQAMAEAPEGGDQKSEVSGQRTEGGAHSALCTPHSSLGTVRYFGDYELLEEMARGGMGVVYRARQVSLNRLVALKMILAGQLASEAEVKRFRHEAEAAANLDHPNIVAIYEVGEHDGQQYFSMRLVEGESVAAERQKSEIRGQKSELSDHRAAAQLLVKVARAIHYAHQRGILHRDLKPGNILVDAKGEPHISDFGLAKRVDLPSDLTRSATVMGTPDFMSPEQAQARNRELTTATDLWSLGAVLYYLCTGRAPFHRETAWETMQAAVNEEPPRPRSLNPHMDRDLETICLKCLEKDPQQRYASADALANDLDRWLHREPIAARPGSTWDHLAKWARRKPAIAALVGAVVLVTMLGLAVSLYYAHEAREKLWQAYLAQARAHRWSNRPGRRFDSLDALAKAAAIRPSLELRNEAIASLALADVRIQRRWRLDPPAAKWGGIVFDATLQRYACVQPDGTVRLGQTQDGRELFRLSSPGQAASAILSFSPDGQYLAARYLGATNSSLHVWHLPYRQLLLSQSDRGYAFDFSPDSRQLAVADGTRSVHFHALPDGTEVRTLDLRSPQCLIRFDPAGHRLASLSCRSSTVRVLDVETGRRELEFTQSAGVNSLAWSPDGSLIGCAGLDGRIYLWDATTGQTNSILERHTAAAAAVAFDRRGDLLVSYGWDGQTRFWDLRLHRQWLMIPGQWMPLAFAANDTVLGFKLDNYEAGLWQVAYGAECRPSMAERFIEAASFSPNGRLLATADTAGVGLWDVTHNRCLGHLPTGHTYKALFDRTGTNLFVSGLVGLQRWPVTFDRESRQVDVGPPETLWTTALTSGALSQDGEILVAARTPQPEVLVFRLRQPGGKPQVLSGLPNVSTVAMSGNGRLVAGGTFRGTGVAVWETSTGALLTNLAVTGNAAVALSPDGEWLATSTGQACGLWDTRNWTSRWFRARDRAADLNGNLLFIPDGTALAWLHSRQTRIKLAAVPTGRELATLDEGTPLCFSRDGAMLATFDAENQQLLFWNLRLIRHELAAIHLDWDLPPLPPSTSSPVPEKLTLVRHPGSSIPLLDLASIPPRDPQTPANLIDLSRYYNAGFRRNWHNLRPDEAGNNLASLPTGVQTFAGIPFDVRGLIQTGAQIGIEFPRQIQGIVIGQSCQRLHFLHAAVHANQVPEGTTIGRYVIHYADGQEVTVPLVLGRDLANWWDLSTPTDPSLVVTWRGTNSAGQRVRLFKTTWDNPRPIEPIQSVDLLADQDRTAPFLVALTGE